MAEYHEVKNGINHVVQVCHGASVIAGWWKETDLNDRHVVPAKLCLVHSEVSEAMEGHRRGLMDTHLPYRPMVEVELADALIRIADLAGAMNLDLGGAVAEKLSYNANRLDHKPEHRAAIGGKTY